jgi:hypothetical protein
MTKYRAFADLSRRTLILKQTFFPERAGAYTLYDVCAASTGRHIRQNSNPYNRNSIWTPNPFHQCRDARKSPQPATCRSMRYTRSCHLPQTESSAHVTQSQHLLRARAGLATEVRWWRSSWCQRRAADEHAPLSTVTLHEGDVQRNEQRTRNVPLEEADAAVAADITATRRPAADVLAELRDGERSQ